MAEDEKKPKGAKDPSDKEPKIGKFDFHPAIQWDDPADQESWNQALIGTPFEVPGTKKPDEKKPETDEKKPK